ncbi:MAG: hypothetical protein HN705_06015, partial [Rhodospirillales bacterium]|nr:hypothetical protein [Rhodospirillales bacterium]
GLGVTVKDLFAGGKFFVAAMGLDLGQRRRRDVLQQLYARQDLRRIIRHVADTPTKRP